jgi:hypothetical protein
MLSCECYLQGRWFAYTHGGAAIVAFVVIAPFCGRRFPSQQTSIQPDYFRDSAREDFIIS